MIVKRLIILGAPGVGKGTQAKRLAVDFGWVHVSTGDMLRDAVRMRTSLGLRAKDTMEKGELVSDEIIEGLMRDRLKEEDCLNGFVLDGFPRNVLQAEKLDELLKDLSFDLDGVVSIVVSDEEIVYRLSRRFVCAKCGFMVTAKEDREDGTRCPSCEGQLERRKDDEPKTVKHRLEIYEEQTHSLIGYYRGRNLLREVDGVGMIDEVYTRICVSLELSPEKK